MTETPKIDTAGGSLPDTRSRQGEPPARDSLSSSLPAAPPGAGDALRRRLTVQLDERVGCVAVYFGEHRNCLDGIEDDETCVYFRRGHWNDRRKEWTVPPDYLGEAHRIHAAIDATLRDALAALDAQQQARIWPHEGRPLEEEVATARKMREWHIEAADALSRLHVEATSETRPLRLAEQIDALGARLDAQQQERCSEHSADPLVLVCVECFESEKTAAATARAEQAEAQLREARAHRRACACAEPDPVMQADGRFYCHTCSFETGARPPNLVPEDWMKQLRAAEAEIARLRAALREVIAEMQAAITELGSAGAEVRVHKPRAQATFARWLKMLEAALGEAERPAGSQTEQTDQPSTSDAGRPARPER